MSYVGRLVLDSRSWTFASIIARSLLDSAQCSHPLNSGAHHLRLPAGPGEPSFLRRGHELSGSPLGTPPFEWTRSHDEDPHRTLTCLTSGAQSCQGLRV